MGRVSRKYATAMAKAFLLRMNSNSWDGRGEKPSDVETNAMSFDIPGDACHRLDISIDIDDGEWCHLCQLVDIQSKIVIEFEHGYGVDSILNLTDTIMDLIGSNQEFDVRRIGGEQYV